MDPQVSQLQSQVALLTKILRSFLAGDLDGDPTSVKWQLAALDPNGDAGQTVAPFEFGQS